MHPLVAVVAVVNVYVWGDTPTHVWYQVFLDRWPASLKHHCPEWIPDRHAVLRKVGQRVLWCDHKMPEPDRDSGSLRIFNALRLLLSEGLHVTFQVGTYLVVSRSIS